MTQYDSAKRYTWQPEDKFELNGQQFGLIINSLRAILNTEEAAKILLAQQANLAIEDILAKSVEAGVAKEMPENNENI